MNSSWCPVERATQIIGDRWSLLILRELSLGPQRFKSLKENVAEISMDQLSRKLDHLCATEMVVRQEFSEAPPRVEYQLTERGLSFLPVLKRILVWSLQTLWSAPSRTGLADVALSLRVMASLLGSGEGLVLLRLSGLAQGLTSYFIHRTSEGRVRVQLITQPHLAQQLSPDAVVEVSFSDWVKLAGSPLDQRSQIKAKIKGNSLLLKRLLPVFSRPGVHESPDGDGHDDPVGRENSVRSTL